MPFGAHKLLYDVFSRFVHLDLARRRAQVRRLDLVNFLDTFMMQDEVVHRLASCKLTSHESGLPLSCWRAQMLSGVDVVPKLPLCRFCPATVGRPSHAYVSCSWGAHVYAERL